MTILVASTKHELQTEIDHYLEYCVSKQLRPKTMKAYEQGLRLFGKWTEQQGGLEYCEDISEAVIRRYIVDLQRRGKYTLNTKDDDELNNYPWNRTDYREAISNTTINNYIRYLRAFFLWLEYEEILERTPMKRVKVLPDQRKPKEYLEDDEVKELLEVLDKSNFCEYRDLIVMMIMLDSGTRLGETLSIEETQIDLKERTIFLPADKTKSRKARNAFFSRKTAAEIKKWLRFKKKACASNYAFPMVKNGEMLDVSRYEKRFRDYIKRTSITKHITPHTLRNNFAKRCLLSGMDIYTLSRILGHSSVTVTEEAYLDVKDMELKGRYQSHSPNKNIWK